MRIAIIFNTDDIEDSSRYLIYLHAMDWALTLLDLDKELGDEIEWGHHSKDAKEAFAKVRKLISEILDSKNISLDMID